MRTIPRVEIPTIAIADSSDRFPVRRIYCVGQNYADHAREMGSDPLRQPPFFFCKPGDAVHHGGVMPYPSRTANLHHEVELVIGLGEGGHDIDPAAAGAIIFGHAVGIDLTRRDLQAEAKTTGRPWDMAKGFDRSAPVSPLHEGVPPAVGAIRLSVDGQIRQEGDLAQMIWSVSEIIAHLSTYVSLAAGDLIFTGTPAGVGPVCRGERLRGTIVGVDAVDVMIE